MLFSSSFAKLKLFVTVDCKHREHLEKKWMSALQGFTVVIVWNFKTIIFNEKQRINNSEHQPRVHVLSFNRQSINLRSLKKEKNTCKWWSEGFGQPNDKRFVIREAEHQISYLFIKRQGFFYIFKGFSEIFLVTW